MNAPEDRKYTPEHEWVLTLSESRVRVGISDFAQDQLGDIVYVELPTVGATIDKGATLAEIESTKSVAEAYAPISGSVVAVNEALADAPETINSDPYGNGWIAEIEGSLEGIDALLDGPAYVELTE